MYVEELTLENIRCFENQTILFKSPSGSCCHWVTFLSENGGGKSTRYKLLRCCSLDLRVPSYFYHVP